MVVRRYLLLLICILQTIEAYTDNRMLDQLYIMIAALTIDESWGVTRKTSAVGLYPVYYWIHRLYAYNLQGVANAQSPTHEIFPACGRSVHCARTFLPRTSSSTSPQTLGHFLTPISPKSLHFILLFGFLAVNTNLSFLEK